jgi:FkbM family methyltransferase
MPKIMRLAEVLRFILNHPLNRQHKLRALGRFLRWQVGSRLAPGPVIIPFVEQTRLVARPGVMGATGIYYTGLYEFEEMAFVLHALRPGDRFVDIGAHIGAFSVLAAGAVGAECLAIEPVPASFAYLQENINLNALGGKVRALNVGIAAQAGRLRFTTGRGAANGVVPPDQGATHFKSALHLVSAIEVDVLPLDAALEGWHLQPALPLSPSGDRPRLSPLSGGSRRGVDAPPPSAIILKIDVEGYEHAVIAGAALTLADDRLVAILIELRGHGARYGFDEDAIHQRLLDAGFQPYSYAAPVHGKGKGVVGREDSAPLSLQGRGAGGEGPSSPPYRGELEGDRHLSPLPGINHAAGTTLYLRNLDLIQNRLATAPRFSVHGQEV